MKRCQGAAGQPLRGGLLLVAEQRRESCPARDPTVAGVLALRAGPNASGTALGVAWIAGFMGRALRPGSRFGVGFGGFLTRAGARLATLLMLHATACFAASIAAWTDSPPLHSVIEVQPGQPTHRPLASWRLVDWKLRQLNCWSPNPNAGRSFIRRVAHAESTSWICGKCSSLTHIGRSPATP